MASIDPWLVRDDCLLSLFFVSVTEPVSLLYESTGGPGRLVAGLDLALDTLDLGLRLLGNVGIALKIDVTAEAGHTRSTKDQRKIYSSVSVAPSSERTYSSLIWERLMRIP